MKPRRPEVAMAEEGEEGGGRGRLGTQGRLGTPLLRMEVGSACHALVSGCRPLCGGIPIYINSLRHSEGFESRGPGVQDLKYLSECWSEARASPEGAISAPAPPRLAPAPLCKATSQRSQEAGLVLAIV